MISTPQLGLHCGKDRKITELVTTAKVLSLTGTASTVDHKVKHEIEYRNRMGILYNTPYPIKIPQKCKCILQLDRTYVIGSSAVQGVRMIPSTTGRVGVGMRFLVPNDGLLPQTSFRIPW
ncbi:hypothetical protein Y032_0207g2036 [Ancylostoma ceylanicum]|uniref:Uncharacterized protein n=1 Tax=Ancylostoma ceylanicum TaxID=53326 RepID=A0A016SLT4_9BILA|nr:hypothetical protein Y032_0207g2036 [Ancylostoma ceylanicum]